MKKVLLCALTALSVHAFAQSQQSLQLAASNTQRAVIAAPNTLPAGTTTFTLPDQTSILISNTNTENYNWQLGGNSAPFTPPYTNNLGTTSADPINFITNGVTRLTLTAAGNTEIIGNLAKIRNINYNWPLAHATGYLQNDGAGNLSWQTSVQASRAGLAQWYENNYGTGAIFMDLNGTTPGGIPHMVSPFPGGLSGLSMVIAPAGNPGTGTITATVFVNNVATTLNVSITGANDFGFTDISGSPIAFNAGDKITVQLNDGGTFAPNCDVLVTLFANF